MQLQVVGVSRWMPALFRNSSWGLLAAKMRARTRGRGTSRYIRTSTLNAEEAFTITTGSSPRHTACTSAPLCVSVCFSVPGWGTVAGCWPVIKVQVMWSRGGGSPDEAMLEQTPHPAIPHPTNLTLFGHKITLYRFNQRAHTIAGGSKRSMGWAPLPWPPHFNHWCWRRWMAMIPE